MPVRDGQFHVPPVGRFGAPRTGGRRHKGMDQYASEGTPIYSAFAGVVEHIGWNPDTNLGFGHNVRIRNDRDDYRIIDAHMRDRPLVQEGHWYPAGTLLGYVGKTGNAVRVGPHDHVEIRKPNGLLVDPATYLPKITPAGGVTPIEEGPTMLIVHHIVGKEQAKYLFTGLSLTLAPAAVKGELPTVRAEGRDALQPYLDIIEQTTTAIADKVAARLPAAGAGTSADAVADELAERLRD